MHDWQSQSRVKWDCKLHVVCIPKYRQKVLYGQNASRDRPGDVEVLEGHAMPDHIRLCLSVPPKYSIAHTIGFLRGKSAAKIHRDLLNRKRMTDLHFWARGSCVSGVGYDEAAGGRQYIREQEQLDQNQSAFDFDD